MQLHWNGFALLLLGVNGSVTAQAIGPDPLEEVQVTGRAIDLISEASSSSQGYVTAADLATRPILRSGELLEVVPGTMVTQHSGTGKANQYFLRGFNLDHGTDFAGYLDGVPLNMRSHGHGQGYLDLNPIIPELVAAIEFGKGPYYGDIGDFSSAGYAKYTLMDELDRGLLQLGIGEDGFYRGVAANDIAVGGGNLLYGLEAQRYDGPWAKEEDAHKVNGLLRYSIESGANRYTLSGLLYDANWDSTDQIPKRAVEQGLSPRLGNIDPSLGGRSTRYSLNGEWENEQEQRASRANVYFNYSDFTLYSNFTYFLEDPANGDQLTQVDRRITTGMNAEHAFQTQAFGRPASLRLGLQMRHDGIADLGLYRSRVRQVLEPVRTDEVAETSAGLYVSGDIQWSDWLRTVMAVRGDRYWFDVDSGLAANSGETTDGILSPKLGIALGPWSDTEFYLNVGRGFHSNDARGTVIAVDPASGEPATPVEPLVKSFGTDAGLRSTVIPNLVTTFTVWYLELDSELVFVGDGGSTEASDKSERYGIEWTNFYRFNNWLSFDFDLSLSQARFPEAGEDEVPNSVGRVITTGLNLDLPSGVFGSLRLRHFGDIPLNEAGDVEAGDTTVLNLQAGYRWSDALSLTLDVFNLLDSKDADITYYFESCLRSDPAALCGAELAERAGLADIHFHPVEPRTIRAALNWRF